VDEGWGVVVGLGLRVGVGVWWLAVSRRKRGATPTHPNSIRVPLPQTPAARCSSGERTLLSPVNELPLGLLRASNGRP